MPVSVAMFSNASYKLESSNARGGRSSTRNRAHGSIGGIVTDSRQGLREQLSEVRRTRFANIPRVRSVMQMMLQTSSSSSEGRALAINMVLEWAASKWPGLIPNVALHGADFEHDQPGLKLAAINLPDSGVWGFAVEHLDTDAGHSRTWVTEAVVAELKDSDLLAVRSQFSSTTVENAPATSPRFVRGWVERLGLIDAGYPIQLSPHLVNSFEDVERLLKLLYDPDRRLPVVVVSELSENGQYPVDYLRLIHRAAALAHVVLLSAQVSYPLSNRLGKQFSVYNGAVRTYMPGFGQPDDRQVHPNVLAPRIADWEEGEAKGAAAFLEFLVTQLHRYSVNTQQKLEQHPGLATLRRQKAERVWQQRAAELDARRHELEFSVGKGREEGIELLELELAEKAAAIEQAEKLRDEQRAKAQELDQLLDVADHDIEAAREENEALRAQNANLLFGLKRLQQGQTETAVPDTYDALPSWVDEQFADRMLLLTRAKRSLKSAVFNDPKLVFSCLQMLAREYWELRTATQESYNAAKRAYEKRREELGVTEAASIASSRLGEVREQYTVNYTIGQSSRQVLDRHLRGGADTKDDRYCLRIYFLWDEARNVVVVGHLPSHLDTRAT